MKNIEEKKMKPVGTDAGSIRARNQFFLKEGELSLFHVFQSFSVSDDINTAIDVTRSYCLKARASVNQRVGMEFLYAYGFLDDLDCLIEKNLASKNPKNRQWGQLYKLINLRRKRKLKTDEYLERLNTLEADSVELECLHMFLRVYAHFERKEYGKLSSYLDGLLLNIHEIKDPLLRELFSVRLDEMLLTFHWKRNEMIIARKHGFRILQTTHCPRKKVDIHNTMALGYLFDSYHQAMQHAIEAKRLANMIEDLTAIQGINNYTIPFIAAFHGRTEGITTPVESEAAHLALARGDVTTCVNILSNFTSLTPFQQYYLGKATRDVEMLEISYRRFVKERSDHFFAKLPLLEMNKLNAVH
ncbi:AimR family lysis-lysogeny pheromone receptor [Virgibacillus senegalensis]|uniref:AimR family lysis-lysogeny pheromone receptor n=1 Tax=Virgibacillus senegalensis TaxID=1499679 RepID=UPI00069D3729|nr:AimR family lysis-lysogeny pheromone receptor [Virgibacillus senegalensis]